MEVIFACPVECGFQNQKLGPFHYKNIFHLYLDLRIEETKASLLHLTVKSVMTPIRMHMRECP